MSQRNSSLPANPPLSPISTLIGTTLFEVAGLILWFELNARGNAGLGLVILFVGLVLERLVVAGFSPQLDIWVGILASSWWEYAAWGLWLTLIQAKGIDPIWIFALVLLPGLHFQHAFTTSFRVNKTFGQLVRNGGFIIFSLIEAVGGALWLAVFTNLTAANASVIPAHLIILVTIAIEHSVQGFVLDAINNEGKLPQTGLAH